MIRREFLTRAAAASAGLSLAPGVAAAAELPLRSRDDHELPPGAADSFTLNLGFGGLCVFVPDIYQQG
ncbi:MAG TPA: hypothetical protein VJT67_11165 [Longimicrobiaceae bacterium]|nr:hypothetical protein [Longimicrobiaceae bacterium]